MDDYNWDDFDAQSAEYLNSDAYQGGEFTTNDGMTWGGQGANNQNWTGSDWQMPESSFTFGDSSWGSVPQGTFNLASQNPQGIGVGVQGDFSQMPDVPQGGQGWPDMGGISNTLANLFNNKGLMTGLGAILEGGQNKKYAQQTPRIVQQMRQQASPFDQASTGASQMGASSMRDAMQQQLARTMQDPYGQPIVKAQVDQLARAQAIKDAAAGRRSNTATSAPALIAEQAKIAQNYINSLYNPAGAGMSAGMGGLEQLLAASKAGINGYTSPMLSALGKTLNTNSYENNPQIQELLQAIKGQ